ncbi:MAG: hypothetical protein DMF92_15160 [Acidobacteria bacterium]|nr:MAG: hypothetical protein DMF92_15160 [Acidobacteriota bacterium]
MATKIQIKGSIVVALIAAALVGRPGSPLWLTLGVIAFGGFNVFLDAPGTVWIRALAIGGTLASLVLPNWFLGPVALIAWLVWVPAFAVAWALAPDPPRHDPGEATRARIALATLIVAVAIGAIAYRVIVWHNLRGVVHWNPCRVGDRRGLWSFARFRARSRMQSGNDWPAGLLTVLVGRHAVCADVGAALLRNRHRD